MANKRRYSSNKQNKGTINKSSVNNDQIKINIKRGKLPSNWNSYAKTHNILKTNEEIVQKLTKYSKKSGQYENTMTKGNSMHNKCVSTNNGRYVAMDCEMVGINENGKDNMLARVSIVDENGSVIYDTFVKPTQEVVDYRTEVSGVRFTDLSTGRNFKTVQNEVHGILRGKVLVGHSLRNDLSVLYLYHNKKYIRDTSKFKKFREETNGMTPSLKFLASRYLEMEIQNGEHSSIEDARAAMLLYLKFKSTWESELHMKKSKR